MSHMMPRPASPHMMPPVFFLLRLIILPLLVLGRSAATDTVSPDRPLVGGNARIVSGNGKFALGFFQAAGRDPSLPPNASKPWYLGMWYNQVPGTITPVWLANRDDPVADASSWQLAIAGDGNLVVSSRKNSSTVWWSTQANATTSDTVAVLQNGGNLVLREASNSSSVLWQSFDHPTDTLLPGAKIGRDKVTGLNRRLVSRKNLASYATGAYCGEFDSNGSGQLVMAPLNSPSSPPYWYSGPWNANGSFFSSLPEMRSARSASFTYVNNEQEEYFIFAPNTISDDTMTILHLVLDVSGQSSLVWWSGGSEGLVHLYSLPSAQCDVYGVCGAFTNCQDNSLQSCRCMKGFSIRSPEDWELQDFSSGCVRNLPLDCGITNKSTVSSTDKFYPMPCVRLPPNPQVVAAGTSDLECAQACLSNCSCTAYSYANNSGCSIWHKELINVKQQQCNSSSSSNGGTLFIRLNEVEVELQDQKHKKGGVSAEVVIGASLGAVGFLALILVLVILISKKVWSTSRLYDAQNGGGIVAFRYADLQSATNNFSERIGGGGFGSVFKGTLSNSTAVAVKRLDNARQGEKQFRAEVSSIGTIQHINLVRLIGFCCEGDKRLLVYEHMPNCSLDAHLFQSSVVTVLKWDVRYQIALGIARGLSYLHESCRDCIIHCDIKPENILLDVSFVPKVADFGMAKFLGRDFSRALTTMRGTAGYLAPEWISGTAITSKVDVYSYGMVLLEMVSGRRNSSSKESSSNGGDRADYFPVRVVHKLRDSDVAGLVDENLQGDVNLEEVEKVCKVACWCIQDSEFDRPTMAEVVQFLEGVSEPKMPPMPRLLHAITLGSHST